MSQRERSSEASIDKYVVVCVAVPVATSVWSTLRIVVDGLDTGTLSVVWTDFSTRDLRGPWSNAPRSITMMEEGRKDFNLCLMAPALVILKSVVSRSATSVEFLDFENRVRMVSTEVVRRWITPLFS